MENNILNCTKLESKMITYFPRSELSYIRLNKCRWVEYSKENLMNLLSEFTGLTLYDSYSYDKWTWGYKYNHAGVREQISIFNYQFQYFF